MKKFVSILTAFALSNAAYAAGPNPYDTGNVDVLCPASITDYANEVERIEIQIESFTGRNDFPWPMLLKKAKEEILPMRLCLELKQLRDAYDYLLQTSVLDSAETRDRANSAIANLETCLKSSKKRSEIESCTVAFRLTMADILDL